MTHIFKKAIAASISIFILGFGFFTAFPVHASENSIDFYFSETCPHCHDEIDFFDIVNERFPDTVINQYSISNPDNVSDLRVRLEEKDALRFFGVTPITFIGDTLFIGFDTADRMGETMLRKLSGEDVGAIVSGAQTCDSAEQCGVEAQKLHVPFIGEIDAQAFSLPVLGIVLGTLDGFNVCSLGALVLILTLVISLRSRKKIATYGGIFIVTTALIYGVLIFLWYQLFSLFASYLNLLQILIGLLSLGGGLYFLRAYIKMKKHGVTCDSEGMPIIGKATLTIRKLFQEKKNLGLLALGVLAFAAVITIVEFPCSAAIPVVYAGMLAEAGLSQAAYIGNIGLFVLFYLLDELIVFGFAVYKMSIWASSPKWVVWITLTEAIILLGLGAVYIGRVIGI